MGQSPAERGTVPFSEAIRITCPEQPEVRVIEPSPERVEGRTTHDEGLGKVRYDLI